MGEMLKYVFICKLNFNILIYVTPTQFFYGIMGFIFFISQITFSWQKSNLDLVLKICQDQISRLNHRYFMSKI